MTIMRPATPRLRAAGSRCADFCVDCNRTLYEANAAYGERYFTLPDAVAAAKKARSLVGVLHRDVVTDAGTCTISTSIGVAVAPEAGREFETLYKNADAALYLTKKRGRNGFTMYSSEG